MAKHVMCLIDLMKVENGRSQAYRNLIAVGATPLAMTDCLNYGSPERKKSIAS